MRKIASLAILFILIVFASCTNSQKSTEQAASPAANPFLEPSKLPFHAADFDHINDADFKPAIEEGIKQQQAEVQKIADNTEVPGFDNTLVALERSGQVLKRTLSVFGALSSANTNPTLQKTQEDEAPNLAANFDAIYLNTKLYNRILAVYQQRDTLKLDPESMRLLEYYKQQFELAGAKLSDS